MVVSDKLLFFALLSAGFMDLSPKLNPFLKAAPFIPQLEELHSNEGCYLDNTWF